MDSLPAIHRPSQPRVTLKFLPECGWLIGKLSWQKAIASPAFSLRRPDVLIHVS